MKLVVASTMAAMIAANPQAPGPSTRFSSGDIADMINSMGATGEAASALYKQFASLEGYRAQSASNAAGSLATTFGIAGGYGCWCYFGDEHVERNAKGPPLDALDNLCHGLSRGYECAILDDAACVPWDVDYFAPDDILAVAETKEAIAAVCEAENNNADSCQYMACAVEQWFIRQWRGNPAGIDDLIDPLHKHSDAGWQVIEDSQCVGPPVGTQRQIECCGVYPTRYPFNTLAPNKDCCTKPNAADPANPIQTMVWNDAFEQCCTDTGEVKRFGETC